MEQARVDQVMGAVALAPELTGTGKYLARRSSICAESTRHISTDGIRHISTDGIRHISTDGTRHISAEGTRHISAEGTCRTCAAP